MFCPVGYRPAIELWHEFVSIRLEGINDLAVKGYNEPSFVAAFSRGSPIDICEHIFLASLAAVCIHVTSPSGDVMRVHIRMADSEPNLFSNTGLFTASLYDAASALGTLSHSGLGFLENARFKAWNYEAHENGELARHYVKSAELDDDAKRDQMLKLHHHSLLHHILRNSYVIADTIPDWALKTSVAVNVAPLLNHFAGWAICVDEATYLGEWQEYLSGRKQVYSAMQIQKSNKGAGRPRLDAARAAFAAMDFEKGALSWEALARKIERETGDKPSPKSLRTWRKIHFNED